MRQQVVTAASTSATGWVLMSSSYSGNKPKTAPMAVPSIGSLIPGNGNGKPHRTKNLHTLAICARHPAWPFFCLPVA
jgi:hypothetical protein